MADSAKIQFYGANWCVDCQRVKRLLGEHQIDYDWIDIDKDAAAAERVVEINDGNKTIPTLVFPDGSHLSEPTNQELATKLGITTTVEQAYCDLAIIGAGPAGMAAAIYTTREGIDTILFERKIVGGQASLTDQIDNYPGFPDGIGGIELAEKMERQARKFGAHIKTGVEVKQISDAGKYKQITSSEGQTFARSVLIAVGSDYRKLGIPGETEFTSRGVHYCATCDAPFYRGKELLVIGGGNSAMQEAIFLTKFAARITLLVRGPELKGSQILRTKVQGMEQIEIHYNFSSTEIKRTEAGKMVVEGVSQDHQATPSFTADGIFVFIGLLPNTAWLKDSAIKLDAAGFIVTDRTFATSLPGVYAAGDTRAGSTLQIASAVGEGVTAALMVREYLHDEG